MRKPEAVIFDMDGVLIDSEPIHYEIENKLFDQLGITVPDDVHGTYLGTSADLMYADLKSRYALPGSVKELMEFGKAFTCDYFKQLPELNLNDGVLSLLKEIKWAGLKLAVATSSSPELARILLNRCEIASYFEAIVTTSEAGKSKPAPDVYLLAARKIGIAPFNCLVFEDSPNGLLAAKSAGMYCIAIQTDSVNIKELSMADFLIPTFKGLTFRRLFEIYTFNNTPK